MQKLLFTLLFVVIAQYCSAQSLKKYPISQTGCFAYFFCDPGAVALEKSPDSSDVYTAECSSGDLSYGIICVKLKDKITDPKTSEDMLVSYLDYLKNSLSITSAAGYGKGHKLKDKEDTRGVIDYWKDKDNNWKVAGWTNGKFICVLYVYTKKDIPETKADVFLNGLLFPGM